MGKIGNKCSQICYINEFFCAQKTFIMRANVLPQNVTFFLMIVAILSKV